jgi:ABC-type Fe3+-hydroxamate transport system substrate-binding protein
VSLAPSSTEILYAVGAGGQLVGVDRYSDFPPAARKLPQLGVDIDPSLERIVALKPDLVFTATSANNRATVETMERLGLTVYVSHADSLAQILDDARALGRATGHAAEGERLAATMEARVAAVRARRAGAPRVRTLVVVWSDPLLVAAPGSHVGDLLDAAGGDNIVDQGTIPFPSYSPERVLARAPDVVVVGTHSERETPLAPLERLSAEGPHHFRVTTIDGDLLFRPGPRVVDGVEALDKLLHPVAR